METTINDIQRVWFSDDKISIETKTGVIKSHPLRWFPRLEKATVEQRNKFELSHFGIHWELRAFLVTIKMRLMLKNQKFRKYSAGFRS